MLTSGPGRAFLHARRLQLGTTFLPLQPGNLVFQRGVLFLEFANPFTKPGHFANQLFDKPAKLLICKLSELGRYHKQYESHPLPDVNREKILSRPGFCPDCII